MGNLLSRLSENLYIHSSPVNFAYVASGMYNQRNYEGDMLSAVEKEIRLAERTLERQMKEITRLCNHFYDEFKLGAHDTITFSDSFDYASFDLAGAKAFQERFLIPLNGKDATSPGQRLFKAMNNQTYQNECKKLFKEKTLSDPTAAIDSQRQKEFRNLVEKIAKGYQSINLDSVAEITVATVVEVLDKLTESSTTRKKGRLFDTTVYKSFKPKAIKNISSINLDSNQIARSIFADEEGKLFNLSKQTGTTKAVQNFKDYFLQLSLQDFVDILWSVLMATEPSLKQVINENRFKSFFLEELKSYGKAVFNIDNGNFVGMLLEQPLVFGINLDLDNFFKRTIPKIKARNIGQNQELKTFADGSSGMYQSGSDIAFDVYDSKGNVKKTYRIQAKNTFQSGDTLNIKIQDKIKLKTYADRIFEEDSEQKKNLFEYLLLNRAFLSQYGLLPGYWERYDEAIHLVNERGSMNYQQKLHKELETYILFFLNQTLAYLIGGKIYTKANEKWNINKQNLFFIYRGKYMIPVSLFLYSAYRLIGVLRENFDTKQVNYNNGIHIDGTIGELTYSSRLDGVKVGMAFARQLRSDKYYYLNHRTDIVFEEDHDQGTIFDSGFRYPDNLVAIGRAAGERLLETAAFPQINFRTHLNEIDFYLNKINI